MEEKKIIQPQKIQLKHSNGPISLIVEYLPEIEQIKMQGLNKDFYGKVIPGMLRKISNPSFSFVFSRFLMMEACEDYELEIVF